MPGDAWNDKIDYEHFNAGVLSLEPAMDEFVEIIASYRNHTVYEHEGYAEQAILRFLFLSELKFPALHLD